MSIGWKSQSLNLMKISMSRNVFRKIINTDIKIKLVNKYFIISKLLNQSIICILL